MATREYHREWKRRWRKKPGNKSKERKQWREWYAKNSASPGFKQKRQAARKRWLTRPENRAKNAADNLKAQKRRQKENPRKEYLKFAKRKYGISEKDLEMLEKQQSYRCYLCGEKKPLEIDHCHETGVIRGLLCSSCNLNLGKYEKLLGSPKLLRKVRYYLRRTPLVR